jgi:hypothetical protein
MSNEPTDSVDDAARARRRDRAASIERLVGDIGGEDDYPVTTRDLAVEYGASGTTTVEDEELASVVESLPEGSFESPEDVREAIERELRAERRHAEQHHDEAAPAEDGATFDAEDA